MTGIKVAIINNQEEKSMLVTKRLTELLAQSDNTIDQENPELVISVGGDGTLLSAFHLFSHRLAEVRFLGVHTGHLGFYTDWRDYELEELVDTLCNDRQKSVSYPLLDVRITYTNGKSDKIFLRNFVEMAYRFRHLQAQQLTTKAWEGQYCIQVSMLFN